ncbi:MAG TPA: MBL fold metallo-hydrolase [Ktedonobacteraceae bacterium]|nr:MBL fold metallo-hydrolase [Ktedonobacteraceae bacterium]
METVTQLRTGLWQISLPFQGEPGIIGSYLLADQEQLLLIDPGPTTTLPALLDTIHETGHTPEAITHILLTHIHLDHAGATGNLLQYTPQAKVYVHRLGAPHLLDTTKVVASATRIYGERMQTLWGEIRSVPAHRLSVLEHGDTLPLSDRFLEIYYTPGHAIHHISFFDPRARDLFAGDVAGVRLQGVDYVRPPTPPPDLDLEAWVESIQILRKLQPSALYLAHFGPTYEVEQHLERLLTKLFQWGDLILQGLRAGKNESELLELLISQTQPELLSVAHDPQALLRYEIATNYRMTVQGYTRYWQKKNPERLKP